jgi:hypothetical protein
MRNEAFRFMRMKSKGRTCFGNFIMMNFKNLAINKRTTYNIDLAINKRTTYNIEILYFKRKKEKKE